MTDVPGATAPEAPASRTVSAATWVAGAMAAANLLGYALNLVASRTLGPAGFGVLGALLGLVLIGNVVALGLQVVTARALAQQPGAKASQAREMYGLALRSAAVLGFAGLAAAPVVARALHLDSMVPALLLGLVLLPLTVTGVQLGLLQGTEDFRRLSWLYVAAAAGKVGGGLAGLAAGGTVTATMAGTALGALAAAGLGHRLLRQLLGGPGAGWPRPARRQAAEVVHASHALLALFALTNVDVLLARHFLEPGAAGRYAVGAVLAKAAFWLPGFVVVVALPALADRLRRRRAARRAIAAVAGTGLVVTAGAALLGDLAVAAVGGSRYQSLAPDAWLFVAAGSLFALAQVLLYSRLAASDRRALAAEWAALALLVGLVVAVRHGSVQEIVTSVLVAAGALVLAGALAELQEHRRRPGQPAALAGQGSGR